jgi:NAD(P)-dependent dehydrogenase (short-subunit alcohol dehydrogenase family)
MEMSRPGTGALPTFLLGDLSSQASIHELARDVHARFSRIDVLLNNAGSI